MAKERIHWIDVAKGMLILLLLVHHFGSAIRGTGIQREDFQFVFCWQFIFTAFFMQAFFFISGFCSNFKKPTSKFFLDLIKQLVLPFCIFELIICLYWTSPNGTSFREVFDYWVKGNGTHLWFLNALIMAKVFIYGFLKISSRNSYLLLCSCALLVTAVILNDSDYGSNFMYIHNAFASIFFVMLGYVAKQKTDIIDKYSKLGGGISYRVNSFILIWISTTSVNSRLWCHYEKSGRFHNYINEWNNGLYLSL